MSQKSTQIKLEQEKLNFKDLAKNLEKMRLSLKKVNILVTNQKYDFKEHKALMTEIQRDYDQENLVTKPIKHIDKIKTQIMKEIHQINDQTKSEITTKLKRILTTETNLSSVKRHLNILESRLTSQSPTSKMLESSEKYRIIINLLINHTYRAMENKAQLSRGEQIARLKTEVNDLKAQLEKTTSKVETEMKILVKEFEGYKGSVVSAYQSSYEQELERYHKVLRNGYLRESKGGEGTDQPGIRDETDDWRSKKHGKRRNELEWNNHPKMQVLSNKSKGMKGPQEVQRSRSSFFKPPNFDNMWNQMGSKLSNVKILRNKYPNNGIKSHSKSSETSLSMNSRMSSQIKRQYNKDLEAIHNSKTPDVLKVFTNMKDRIGSNFHLSPTSSPKDFFSQSPQNRMRMGFNKLQRLGTNNFENQVSEKTIGNLQSSTAKFNPLKLVKILSEESTIKSPVKIQSSLLDKKDRVLFMDEAPSSKMIANKRERKDRAKKFVKINSDMYY